MVSEVSRAVRRVHGHDHDAVLGQVLDLIQRTQDAIHLASALLLAPRLDAFIAYDDRLLAAAATQSSLPVERPDA